jgi:hypothetical protein
LAGTIKTPPFKINPKPVQPENGGEKPLSITGTCGLNQIRVPGSGRTVFMVLLFAF